MQSKILIVIGREYTTRVRKKSFIILTVLMPFLIAALVALPLLLGMIKDSEAKTVAVVDSTHRYESLFKDTPPTGSSWRPGWIPPSARKAPTYRPWS